MSNLNRYDVPIKDVYDFCVRELDENIECLSELDAGYFDRFYEVTIKGGNKLILKVEPKKNAAALSLDKGMTEKEYIALKAVRKAKAVLVPRVIKAPKDDNALGGKGFFMEYLDGVPLRQVAYLMKPAELNAFYEKLGRHLVKVHDIKAEFFGYGIMANDRWSLFFERQVTDILSDASAIKADIATEPQRILAAVRKFAGILDEVKEPSLVHGDLLRDNIILNEKTFTILGIIDWDRAVYGDPLMDFVFAGIEGQPHANKKAFYLGYGKNSQLSPSEKIRVNLYYMYYLILNITESYYRLRRDILIERKALNDLENVLVTLENTPATIKNPKAKT